MTLQEALIVLATHQQWRRGAEIEMAEPKVITEALDVVLAYHHVGANEMIDHISPNVTNKLSFGELSDEEIEKAAPVGNLTTEFAWINGAKWYREQIKSNIQ
jgi:hypothetical protein